MKVSSPKAILDLDYRKLTVAEGQGKWRMKSLRDTVFNFDADIIPDNEERVFAHQYRPWLKIEPRRITIAAGYAWNGNSPKRGYRFLWRDWWFGTPDFFPGTVKASQLHDALFQFSPLPAMPFGWELANDFYRQLANAHGHPLDDTYALVLKICAAKFWGDKPENLTCTITHEVPCTSYPGYLA